VVRAAECTLNGARRSACPLRALEELWRMKDNTVRCTFPIQIAQSGGGSIQFRIAGPLLYQLGRCHHQRKGNSISYAVIFFFDNFGIAANFRIGKVFVTGYHDTKDRDVQFHPFEFKSLSKGCIACLDEVNKAYIQGQVMIVSSDE